MNEDFEELLKLIAELVKKAVIRNFELQGHVMTGDLISTINYQITSTDIGGRIDFILNDYGMYQNYGVPADKIKNPFARPRIEGLTKFAKIKLGISNDKEATRVAFAIAKKQSVEGMPTKNSKAMGKKTGAINDALEETNEEIQRLISDAMDNIITSLISDTLENYTN